MILLLKNFEVYPKEVTLIRIKDIFELMNQEFLNSAEYAFDPEMKLKIEPQQKCFIDFKRFVFGVCLISLCNENYNTAIDKIIFILKKMSLSEGVSIAQKKRAIP